MAFTWDRDDPLARGKGETARANAALRDYALMGAGRSLRKLLEQYRQQTANGPPTKKPPTLRFRTLAGWSTRHDWQDRVEAWEAGQRQAREARLGAARQRVEDEGLADADKFREELLRTFDEVAARFGKIALDAGAKLEGAPSVRVFLDARSLRDLVAARSEIERLRRLAVGLPDRITQDRHADAEGGKLVAKGYVGISPDDWDCASSASRGDCPAGASLQDAQTQSRGDKDEDEEGEDGSDDDSPTG